MTLATPSSVNLRSPVRHLPRGRWRVHVSPAPPPPRHRLGPPPVRWTFPTFGALDCTLVESPAAATEDEQDRALVRRCLDGERNAASDLVDRYQRRLFNVAFRMLGNVQDAEDVTQTVFGNAFVSLGSFDPKYRFFSWIYRMAVNESLNTLKRRKRMVTLEDHLAIPAPGGGTDDALEAEDRVEKALMDLKPDDRAVVVLRHFVSFSYEEMADVLEVPVRTVKSRLFTARERLRQALLGRGA
ncbi:MAG: sigma-70 family RNA polymerase sigma factor [Gemmatimonadaceae bacterium]